MQMGLVTPVFRRELPHYRIAQLAIAGRQPVATLEDLADDPSFTGLAICDFEPFLSCPI